MLYITPFIGVRTPITPFIFKPFIRIIYFIYFTPFISTIRFLAPPLYPLVQARTLESLSFFPGAELIGFGFLHGMAAHQVRFPAA